ncbi:hypothetical protein BH10PSE13_BH10PSE13_21160 [soil metagenome]
MAAFARRAIELALEDRDAAAANDGWTFFDRSLIDAAAALDHVAQEGALRRLGTLHRYHPRVFMTPPWPAIYATDADRQHDLEAAVAEYHRLLTAYEMLGYAIAIVPQASVKARADWMQDRLDCE